MRPIDADRLIKEIRETNWLWLDDEIEKEMAIHLIKRQPTIEAAPVVHGEWAYLGESGMSSIYGCSCCGYRERKTRLSSFCPNCGAKMRTK